MLKHLLCILLLTQVYLLSAQTAWTDFPEKNIPEAQNAPRYIIPRQYRTVRLDLNVLQPVLAAAPERFSSAEADQLSVLTLPLPDGSWGRFRLTESPVMAPALQAKYPEIRCYSGTGIDDPTASLKCDLTPQGFHAMIRSARQGTVFIDPYRQGDREHCVVYRKQDFQAKKMFSCELDDLTTADATGKDIPAPDMQGDCTLRRYRLALACTGEYAIFHGGTKALALAAMNTTINRVNGIYERDLAITMQLIANNDVIVYTDPVTDGFTNGNGTTMLGQNQTKCNNLIGAANYDIGHVFSTQGGGIAGLGVVCGNSVKARGVTGLTQPVGDPFDVDYVSHEMGHQFGGNHCFNNTCSGNINPGTAFEPGSGSTIMGYAGVCTPNVQNNSDAYFHAISLQEIGGYVTVSQGGICALEINTGNSAPTVDAGPNYTIPKATPFALKATASDVNGDALTYCWEQMDNQQASMPPVSTNTGGPMFRSFDPVPFPTRYFPRLADLVNNVNSTWEELPGVARSMNFRVTVRDNRAPGGCTAEDNLALSVAATAGPFVVTEPNTAVLWYVGDSKTVTWDVANTDVAPVNCAQVRLLLSTDGGFTYPVVLADAVPNNGSASITVPDNVSANCRVMVQAVGNVFFDISNQNFSIEVPPTPTFLFDISAKAAEQVCTGTSLNFNATVNAIAGFSDPVQLNLTGAPAGADVVITPNPVTPGSNAMVGISNLDQPGVYTLTLEASSGAILRSRTIELTVLNAAPAAPALDSPADAALNTTLAPTLIWVPVANALQYQLQVATNPAFEAGALVYDQIIPGTEATLSGLDTSTVYYWRVTVENACGRSAWSPVFAFQTGRPECGFSFSSADVPVAIATNDVVTVSSTLNIPSDRSIADVNLSVQVDHTWVGDLVATLRSPDGGSALLFDQPGFPATSSGCSGDNLALQFDDAAAMTAAQLENSCGSQPAISGAFQPIEPLSQFNNRSASGAWTLEMSDLFPEDGGAITAWSLDFCFFDTVAPAQILVNNPLDVASGGAADLSTGHLVLDIFSGNAGDGQFVLLTLPQHGALSLDGTVLGIGGIFTQDDILAGLVTYTNNGDTATTDLFHFDAVDQSTAGWVHDAVFHINILQNTLDVSAEQTKTLRCHNDSDAQITVSATGGYPPLQYSLNGGAPEFSGVFDGLAAGTYTVVVSDQLGFTAETNAVVIDNPLVLTAMATVTDDDITVHATGGSAPLEYSLDNQTFQSDSVFQNLANGSYTLTVRDAKGCTGTTTAIVAVGQLLGQLVLLEPISCNAGSNGSIAVTAAGGVGPYSYSLNGTDFQSAATFSGLNAGSYTVVIRDDSGNTATTNAIVLNDPPAISVAATADLNRISVNASGGTGALSYSLDGVNFQAESSFDNLANGDYTVTVMDANGCTATAPVTVDVPPLEILSIGMDGFISCNGGTLLLRVSATGGIPPYAYSLNGGPFQQDSLFEQVGAGLIEVRVRDAAGTVVQSQPFTIVEPDPLLVTVTLSGNDATVNASGDAPPYTYELNGVSQSTNQFMDLPNGQYMVVVTGSNGCTATATFEVNYIPLTIATAFNDPLCAGDASGDIFYTATGGTPPYSCSMNGDPCNLSGLSAGTYQFAIVDALGDSVAASVTLTDPPALSATAAAAADSIMVTATGGTGALEYSLDGVNYQSSPVFTGLPNGTYAVRVRDANGCILVIENVVVDFVGTVSPAAAWGLVVQPNPSSGLFRLNMYRAPGGLLRADVFDASGRLLLQERYETPGGAWSAQLDLNGFPPDVYWLRLTSAAQVGTLRLVVE